MGFWLHHVFFSRSTNNKRLVPIKAALEKKKAFSLTLWASLAQCYVSGYATVPSNECASEVVLTISWQRGSVSTNEAFCQCNADRCEVDLRNVVWICEFSLMGKILSCFLCWHGKGKFRWNDNCINEHFKAGWRAGGDHYHVSCRAGSNIKTIKLNIFQLEDTEYIPLVLYLKLYCQYMRSKEQEM